MAFSKTGSKPIGLPLADLLYTRRIQLGLSQQQLAKRLREEAKRDGSWSGATPQLIHRYELGTTPRSDSMAWLGTSLKLSLATMQEQARRQRARLESARLLPYLPLDSQQTFSALVDSDDGSGESERREFVKVDSVGSPVVLPGLDLERFHAILTGTRVDSQSLDQLAALTDRFMRQSWSINPRSLLPAIAGHFNGFGNILLGVPPALSSRAHSMTGEIAFLAGYLSLESGLSKDAEFYWQTAERMAQSANNRGLQSTLLTFQGWKARDEGQPARALTALDQAQSLLGRNPNPVVAAFTYYSRSYDLAAMGRSQEAGKDIEKAEQHLKQIPENDMELYLIESIRDDLDSVKGWHLLHLQQYSDAAQVFEQILARIDPAWKAQQAYILAHLGAVHAKQGEAEQAAQTFSKALGIAREAGSSRYEQRTAMMRKQWLGNNDSPAVQRLDEEFLTPTPSGLATKRCPPPEAQPAVDSQPASQR
ncbi:MAG: hypothetical protein ACREN8_04780 [Candidatus Dormibacteraceae bacterium]